MKKALSCQAPGRALPPPRAVPQRHGGRVPPPDRSEAANLQSGGGLCPREADRDPREKFFWCLVAYHKLGPLPQS